MDAAAIPILLLPETAKLSPRVARAEPGATASYPRVNVSA